MFKSIKFSVTFQEVSLRKSFDVTKTLYCNFKAILEQFFTVEMSASFTTKQRRKNKEVFPETLFFEVMRGEFFL